MQVAFPVPLSSVSLDMRYWLTGLAVRQSASSRSANNLNGYWRVATTELTRSAGLYGHVASTASSPRGYYYLRRPITTVVTRPVCRSLISSESLAVSTLVMSRTADHIACLYRLLCFLSSSAVEPSSTISPPSLLLLIHPAARHRLCTAVIVMRA